MQILDSRCSMLVKTEKRRRILDTRYSMLVSRPPAERRFEAGETPRLEGREACGSARQARYSTLDAGCQPKADKF
jgi:hypothetical protein